MKQKTFNQEAAELKEALVNLGKAFAESAEAKRIIKLTKQINEYFTDKK